MGSSIDKHISLTGSRCRCGVNDKKSMNRCCPTEQYDSRCPCLKQSKKCTMHCLCKQCGNPYGHKPIISLKKRRRQTSLLQISHFKNTEFLKDRNEDVTKGNWSILECVLLRRVVNYVGKNKASIDDIKKVFDEVVQVINDNGVALPVGKKSITAIMYKVQEQSKLLSSFETTSTM